MAKNRCPSEINTRVIRINVGTYLVLRELSQKLGITMAEALDLAVTEQSRREQVTIIPRTQLRLMPISTAIAINGSKAAAFVVKGKGVRYE